MVDDDIVGIVHINSINAASFKPGFNALSHPDSTYYNIVCIKNLYKELLKTYSVPWRSLSCNGNTGMADNQMGFQFDGTRYPKEHDPWVGTCPLL